MFTLGSYVGVIPHISRLMSCHLSTVKISNENAEKYLKKSLKNTVKIKNTVSGNLSWIRKSRCKCTQNALQLEYYWVDHTTSGFGSRCKCNVCCLATFLIQKYPPPPLPSISSNPSQIYIRPLPWQRKNN